MNTKPDPLAKLHALPKESQDKVIALAASKLALEKMRQHKAKKNASDTEKIVAFCDYLEERIHRAQFERQRPDLANRIRAILKTEIAELETIRVEFERLFLN